MKTPAAQKSKQNSQPVIQNIIIKSVRRTTQDIQSWRNALTAAEAEQPRRVLLYDLYEDLLLDGHLRSVCDKRIMAVTNSPLIFVAKNKSVDVIAELQEKPWFEALLTEIMNSKLWGHTLFEFMYDNNGNFIGEHIPRKNVEHKAGIILKNQTDTTGILYREDKSRAPWLLETGTWKQHGLLLPAAQYVIYKRGNFGDWAQYAEVFGMPWKVGEYNGFDEKNRQQLEAALEAAGGNANIIIPEGTKLDIKFATSAGDGSLYEKLKDACDESLSILILGQTMTTKDTSGSGYAQGKIHSSVEQDMHRSDRRFVARILNNDLNPLLALHGFPVAEGKWVYKEEENIELKEKKINIDMQVARQVPVDDDYFYETYGIPKPANYNELKAAKEAARLAVAAAVAGGEDPDPDKEDPKNLPDKTQDPELKKTKKLSDKQTFAERFFSFFS
jgi:phage gp29-like protein